MGTGTNCTSERFGIGACPRFRVQYPNGASRDLLEAARSLRRDPWTAAAVVASLGIAIGAGALLYAFVEAVLLRAAGVREPERLVVMWEEDLDRDRHLFEVSFANFLEWRSRSRSFGEMAAMGFHDWSSVLLESGEPERIPYRAVSASFFRTLGAEPLLGRTFLPEDDEPSAERVVVLSHALWQRRFGGDPAIVGRALTFETSGGGEPFVVVGVMPEDFDFPPGAQLWSPAGREIAEIASVKGLSRSKYRPRSRATPRVQCGASSTGRSFPAFDP